MEWRNTGGVKLSCQSLVDLLSDSHKLEQQSQEKLVELSVFALHNGQYPIKLYQERADELENCELLNEKLLNLIESKIVH